MSILLFFLVTLALFLVQKLFFLALTGQGSVTAADVWAILGHGLQLDLAMVGYTLAIPVLLLGMATFVPGRWLQKVLQGYYLLISFLLALIIVVDAGLYPFWQFKIDPSIFLYTDKPQDALASVSGWFILQQVLWIGVWTAVPYYGFHRVIQRIDCCPKRQTATKKATVSLSYLLVLGVLFLLIRGGIGKSTNNVSMAYFTNRQYINHATVNPAFNLFYNLTTMNDLSLEASFFSEEEAQAITAEVYPMGQEMLPPDTLLLKTQRPNILLIIWEGGGTEVLNRLGADCRTRAWAQEGVDFTQCQANSFRTDRGQVCLLSGWPAIPKTSLNKLPDKCDKLSAFPRILAENGYFTTFWYGGDLDFANTNGYMHQAGFQTTVGDKNFDARDRATDWGVWDETLLDKLYDHMMQQQEHPTFDCVMTLSSHEPWTVPVQRFEDEKLNAFAYTDACLDKLLNKLKQSPLWDNLLVILTADHGVMLKEEDVLYSERVTHIPMIWTGGAIRQPAVFDQLLNQSDLPATLLGQLGLSHQEFLFSRDVLSPSYTNPSAFHVYNGGITYVDSTGRTTYDLDGKQVILQPDAERERKVKGILQGLYQKIKEL